MLYNDWYMYYSIDIQSVIHQQYMKLFSSIYIMYLEIAEIYKFVWKIGTIKILSQI